MLVLRLVLLSVLATPLANAGGKHKNRGFATKCEVYSARAARSASQSFEDRLAELVPDPAQRQRMGRGAEGDVYAATTRPDRALKIWRNNDMQQFVDSVGKLVTMGEALKTKRAERLSCCLYVVGVYNIGPNWIEREFFPNSIPIREALKQDGQARRTFQKVVEELKELRGREPFDVIYEKLKAEKPNFHWDPASKQIILIDSQ